MSCVIGVVKVYIGNLPATATEAEVRELLSPFGTLHSIKTMTNNYPDNKPHFIVEMDEAASFTAIRKLSGSVFQEQRLDVWESMLREPKKKKPPE